MGIEKKKTIYGHVRCETKQRLSKTYFEKITKFIKSRELSDLGY